MSKSNRSIFIVIVILLVLSTSMFVYQNIYLPRTIQAELVTVYVAKQDIKPLSEVSPEMFDVIRVDKNTLHPALVTDLREVEGLRIRGGLLRGELLATPRLTQREINKEENLTVEIIADFESNASRGDFINVYAILQNRHKNEIEIRRLLTTKEVFADRGDGRRFTVRLTEKELENYYIAQELGKIVVSRVDMFNRVSEPDIDLRQEQENYTTIREINSEEIPVILYTIKEGETLEEIALKFRTTSDMLIQLNDDIENFEAGTDIFVPAN